MKNNTIWITGAEGKLGSILVQLFSQSREYTVIGTDQDVDVTDLAAIEQAGDMYRPNIIINCASLTGQDHTMVETFRVNALGARNMAAASRRLNAKIVQISTDDVFDGKREGSHTEFDTPEPVSIYGKSKLAGENYVRELNPKHLIIRSSWVYSGKKDFLAYVLDKGQKGETFEVPMDQISTPTSALALGQFLYCLLSKTEYGIFHASCEGVCSRHDFARMILELKGYDPALAVRTVSRAPHMPSSTLLENLMLKMTGIYEMPSWQDDLKAYLSQKGAM